MITITDSKVYKIGLYIRLSREDGDDLESESITNQRSLIKGYLAANGIESINEYVDDGYSGGNFNRPSFKKLIADIEKGIINCVITKDLSRLGRDYIDTGMYVERYFPENNIRYIAINDDVDTFKETSGSDMMPFKLSMNDMYAKDISKKVRSSLIAKKKIGLFLGSTPCYGYMKSEKNKHILIPDPETAPVVKKIFDLYISGYSSSEIAEMLTRDEVPTPIMVKCMAGRMRKADRPHIWKHTSISNIIKNRTYTGCLIQHTSQNISYKTQKRKILPKSEWIIKDNCHEPIIDDKTYRLAQDIKKRYNTYSPDRRSVEYALANLIYCKNCGARMYISYDRKRERITMNCTTYRKFSKYGFCFSHYINYSKLEKTIFLKLKGFSLQYLDNETFEKRLKENYVDPTKEIHSRILDTKLKIKKLENKLDNLYEDKCNGVVNNEMFVRISKNSNEEIESLKKKKKNYEKEKAKLLKSTEKTVDYKKIVMAFLNIENPTQEMMNKIIKKIYITKEKKIEIHYNIMDFNYLKN
ncbi:MAG: recombinase family protein [Tissierellia bacterium]|nr:recombinase family protein [Tissierellia bacterium]MDD4781867.1 recombinase family protein [Tissierellia bacterium]